MRQTFPATLPESLTKNAWWLTAAPADRATGAVPTPQLPRLIRPTLLLIILTDWLAYGHSAGLGLALAATAFVSLVALHTPAPQTARGTALITLFLGVAPFLEQAQALSLAFLTLGALASIAILKTGTSDSTRLRIIVQDLITRAPIAFATTVAKSMRARSRRLPVIRTVRNWLPAALIGASFIALFAVANPIIGDLTYMLATADWLTSLSTTRLLTWSAVAFSLGTALHFRPTRSGLIKPEPRPKPHLSNNAPITNALWVFNVIFAAQTVLDLAYLWGGAGLPDGMTYARYAHRGAYPLLTTSLLAGTFMLAATRFGHPTPLLRHLLVAWIAQNLLLLASAILRLNLYVAFYAPTYLRVAAFVWMALVGVGLLLMLWRIYSNHSNKWLIWRWAIIGTTTLYLTCFINVTHMIASYNVAHSLEASGQGTALDRHYLCQLGWAAKPAADRFDTLPNTTPLGCFQRHTTNRTTWRYADAPRLNNWREWGFRRMRLSRYLAPTQPTEAAHANHPDR